MRVKNKLVNGEQYGLDYYKEIMSDQVHDGSAQS